MILRKKLLISLTTIIAALFLLIPIAQADEPYDLTSCWSGDVTMLSARKNLVIFSFDIKGVSHGNHENKAFDNHSFQMVGINKIEAGNRSGTSYAKYLSPEGDIVFGEIQTVGDKQTQKFLFGTGKWEGITGGGKTEPITNVKPIKEGTTQGCARATGTYQLPQQNSEQNSTKNCMII